MPEPRIVSLLPSATEIVCGLGFRENLVGRSHECDFPADVAALPVCTGSKIDNTVESAEIDRRVRTIVETGLSVYKVHADLMRELAPDVIVTQDQCEVCAVSLSDVEAAVCDWTGLAPTLVSLSPQSFDDVWTDIARVADALGVADRAAALNETLKARMAAIAETASSVDERPSVATIEWIEPPMAAGNWMPDMVEMAGGTNLFGESGQHSPWLEWDALTAADPDVLVVLPCGFSMDRAEADMPHLEARSGWHDLKAVRTGQVYITDGHHFFNRPGPRLVESLEILAEILHSDRFDFGHRGGAWRPWQGNIAA